MTQKVIIKMPVAVHPIQAKLWQAIESKKITNEMTYREIAKIIGEAETHPQQIKHHLEQLGKKGALQVVAGSPIW